MRKLSYAVEQNPVSILMTDAHGIIEYANRKFTEVSGYTQEELLGKTPYFLQTSTLTAEAYQHLQRAIAAGGVWQGELCNRQKDGELFWESALVSAIRNEQGVVTHFVWLREDITERKRTDQHIEFLANYDHLTRLPNRVLLQERLREAIELAKVRSQMLAVMFLDLDQFKRINDSFGHRVGDLLLQQVAVRLQDCVRSADRVYATHSDLLLSRDVLARLGGDEFVILTEINDPDDIAKVARRILTVIAQPFMIDSNEIFSGCSIGIALYPLDGADMETLLKNADAALYHAKSQGRNNYQLYSDRMHAATIQHVEMEGLLRKALARQELTLHLVHGPASLRRGRDRSALSAPASGASRCWSFWVTSTRAPFQCRESFEGMSDADLRGYAAIIVPSGMVADRLRYTEDPERPPPATEFLQRAFAEPTILKGIICHGMWLVAPMPELVRGRRVVVHNNLVGDARAYGAVYTNEDVVVDGDLITARSGGHCHQFARALIDRISLA